MRIRKAARKDIPRIAELLKEFKEFNIRTLSPQNLVFLKQKNYDIKTIEKQVKMAFKIKDSIVFVAEENGKIVGYVFGYVKKRGREYIMYKTGYIDHWFVTEKSQGRKIGKRLLGEITKWFKKQKCSHLTTEVFVDNKKAIKIYKKLGFRKYTIEMKKKI